MRRVLEFLANCGDGVFAVDSAQSIVLWNDRAGEILGFRAGEVVGKKCFEVLGARDIAGRTVCRPGCECLISAECLRPAATTDVQVRLRQGGATWLNMTSLVVPTLSRELWVLVHLFREITREHDLFEAALGFARTVQAANSPDRVSRSAQHHKMTSETLTPREIEILRALSSGASTKVIAETLGISPRTVCNHISNILQKLDLHSRLEAVTFAIKNGLI